MQEVQGRRSEEIRLEIWKMKDRFSIVLPREENCASSWTLATASQGNDLAAYHTKETSKRVKGSQSVRTFYRNSWHFDSCLTIFSE